MLSVGVASMCPGSMTGSGVCDWDLALVACMHTWGGGMLHSRLSREVQQKLLGGCGLSL